MDIDAFKNEIKKSLKDVKKNPDFQKAGEIIEEAAKAIEELYKDSKMNVDVELGFKTNLGQQMNVVVYIDPIKFRDVLFRAYIPIDGFPVSLDLFGEELQTCKDDEELQGEIIKFIKREDVSSRLLNLSEKSKKY